MKFKITWFQKIILKWICRKIVIQSYEHKNNIIEYYKIIYNVSKNEFYEDNKLTLNYFLQECFDE